MKGTTTYLHFPGNCRTAMAYYRECLGGDLAIVPYPDASGRPSSDPTGPAQHSSITQGGKAVLMGSDAPPGSASSAPTKDPNNAFSVFLDCSSPAELDALFDKLSRDGQITVPPSDMPSGRFAMCDDSFGISWILSCAAT